jgi:hypothetical protein
MAVAGVGFVQKSYFGVLVYPKNVLLPFLVLSPLCRHLSVAKAQKNEESSSRRILLRK